VYRCCTHSKTPHYSRIITGSQHNMHVCMYTVLSYMLFGKMTVSTLQTRTWMQGDWWLYNCEPNIKWCVDCCSHSDFWMGRTEVVLAVCFKFLLICQLKTFLGCIYLTGWPWQANCDDQLFIWSLWRVNSSELTHLGYHSPDRKNPRLLPDFSIRNRRHIC